MKSTIFLLLVGLMVIACDDRSILNSVFRDIFLNSTSNTCPNCSQKKLALESILSEGEIKKYRIEFVKKTILDNLGLDKPPILPIYHWPKPFKSGAFIDHTSRSDQNGQWIIEKLILIPQGMTCEVEDLIEMQELSLTMMYILPRTINPMDITSVKVWLNFAQGRESSYSNKEPKAFYMEITPCNSETNEHITTFRGFQSINGDWIEFDAMPVLGSLLERRETCFNVSLSMKSWTNTYCKSLRIPEHKPFVTVHYKTNGDVNHPRLKRSRNCTKSSSECCRENLYVSFSEIGWDKWIIFPPGYEAYYCKGSCSGASSLTLSATTHNSVIQGLLHVSKDVTSCCAPTKMSSMEFLVQYNNNTAKFITMPDIVVEACGCM